MNPSTRIQRAQPPGRSDVTLGELVEIVEKHGDLRDGDRWGPWTYHADVCTLSWDERAYDVALSRCRTLAERYDWIMHLAGKAWVSDADLGAFVRALAEVSRALLG